MTPYVFDTLSASRQLREAGMPEGVAEAVVAVFQHATTPPDLSHLATKADLAVVATKADLADFATRADLARFAMKADLAAFATRTDLAAFATRSDFADMATKADIAQVRLEIANLRASVSDTIRQQGWLLLGGVGVLMAIFTGVGKVLG